MIPQSCYVWFVKSLSERKLIFYYTEIGNHVFYDLALVLRKFTTKKIIRKKKVFAVVSQARNSSKDGISKKGLSLNSEIAQKSSVVLFELVIRDLACAFFIVILAELRTA